MKDPKLPVPAGTEEKGALQPERPFSISPSASEVFTPPPPTGDYVVDRAIERGIAAANYGDERERMLAEIQRLVKLVEHYKGLALGRDPLEAAIAEHGREWWAAILFHRCDGKVICECYPVEGKAEQSASRLSTDFLHGMRSDEFSRTTSCKAELLVTPAYLDGYMNYLEYAHRRLQPWHQERGDNGK